MAVEPIRRRTRPSSDQSVGPLPGSVFWSDTRFRLEGGDIVPFVGNSISADHLFPGEYQHKVAAWAGNIGYPWGEQPDLTAVAQYALIQGDALAARRSYLDYLKTALLERAYDDSVVSEKQYETALDKKSSSTYTVTDMARDLGYLNFREQRDHPLSILARLPFRVYITTSYHSFLEVALEQYDKKPVSEIYPWNPDPKRPYTSIFQKEPGFEPKDRRPLVYHLYGRDDDPNSLVLTENDHLDFLVQLADDKGQTVISGTAASPGLPTIVTNALTYNSSPLLLGYSLQDWDFRVLFRGLVASKKYQRDGEGICIQVKVARDQEELIRQNLQNYLLKTSKLKIYWVVSSPGECLQELETIWRPGAARNEASHA
jgi:hypothetical protein